MHWIQDLQDGVIVFGKVNSSECPLCSKMKTETGCLLCKITYVYIYACIYKITYMYVCIVYLFFLFLGDSFSQFRFAEEKEWDGETSCPKQVREMF